MKLKKGGIWNIVISGILVIVILFGASYFFTTESWKGTRAFLGLGHPKEGESEAHPVKGCSTIRCSMNALTCAVNSIALGRPGWLEPNPNNYCPEGGLRIVAKDQENTESGSAAFIGRAIGKITGRATSDAQEPESMEDETESCEGASYGDVCVQCGGEVEFRCDVKRFSLPQDIEQNLIEKYVDGIGDPYYIAYYEKFPEGEDAYWKSDRFSWSLLTIAASAGINAIIGPGGGLGDDVAKAVKREGFKKISKANLKASFTHAVSQSFILNSVKRAMNWVRGATARKMGKLNMLVRAFSSIDDDVVRSLSRAGKLEDLKDGLLPFVGRSGQIIDQAGAEHFVKGFLRNHLDGASKIGGPLRAVVKAKADDLAKETSLVAFRRTSREFSELLEKVSRRSMPGIDDALRADVARFASEYSAEGITKGRRLAGELGMDITGLSNDKVFWELAKYRRAFNDGMWKLAKQGMADSIVDSASIGSLAAAVTRKQLRLMSRMDALEKLLDTFRGSNRAIRSQLKKQLGKKSYKVVESLADLPGSIKRNVLEAQIEILSAANPRVINKMMKLVEKLDIATLTTTYDKLLKAFPFLAGAYLVLNAEGDPVQIAIGAGMVTMPGKVVKLADFARKHKLATIMALGIPTMFIDKQLERELSKGEDVLQLSRSIGLGDEGEEIQYKVSEEAKPYYIELVKDDKKSTERFHLVSPCKTDLNLKRESSECRLKKDISQYDIYDFGKGKISIRSDSVNYNSDDLAFNKKYVNMKTALMEYKRQHSTVSSGDELAKLEDPAEWMWKQAWDNPDEAREAGAFSGWYYKLDGDRILAWDHNYKIRVYEPFLNYWGRIKGDDYWSVDEGRTIEGNDVTASYDYDYKLVFNRLYRRNKASKVIERFDPDEGGSWKSVLLETYIRRGLGDWVKVEYDKDKAHKQIIDHMNADRGQRNENKKAFFDLLAEADTYKDQCGVSPARTYSRLCCHTKTPGTRDFYFFVDSHDECQADEEIPGMTAGIVYVTYCGVESTIQDYEACNKAVKIYHNITYTFRDAYISSGLFDYDGDVHNAILEAEESLLNIYRSALTEDEFFKIIGRDTKDKGRYMDSAGNNLAFVSGNRYYSRITTLEGARTHPECNGKIWGCMMEALYDGDKGFFGSVRNVHKNYLAIGGMGAIGDMNLIGNNAFEKLKGEVPLNKAPYGQYNYRWNAPDIALYIQYRLQDCIEAARIIETIPIFFMWYRLGEYSDLMESLYVQRCVDGMNSMFPKFLEKKMMPHYMGYRRRIGDAVDFDHHVLPEFRRIELDKQYNDDSFYDLFTKKRYYQAKADALEKSRDKAGIVAPLLSADYDRIRDADFKEFENISMTLKDEFGSMMDLTKSVKLCKKPEFLKGGDFWDPPILYTPESIRITPNMHPYSDEEFNYCYAGELSGMAKGLKCGAIISAIFLDSLVAAGAEYFTGGCGGITVSYPGTMLCGRAALALKGAGEVFLIELAEKQRNWPKHALK